MHERVLTGLSREVLDVDEEAEVEESSRGTGATAPQARRQLQLGQLLPVFRKHRRDPNDNVADRDDSDYNATDDYDIDSAAAGTATGIGVRGPPINRA